MRRLFLFAVFLVAGCQTNMARADRDVGSHQPQPYKEGYADGCDGGYVAAGHPYYQFRKDVSRHATDATYKSGWDDGFAICKGKCDSIRR